MIRNDFYIVVNNEPWFVTIFLPRTRWAVNEIMSALSSIGISNENAKITLENLMSGRINNGITFSNEMYRRTISVWDKAATKEDWLDLITHELHHLSVHIASANGLDLSGEEVCYINGGIAKHLYNTIKRLII